MKYDAISLDTNIFTNNGYALENGLLGQLKQFKQGPVKFVLSEIIYKEVLRHITEENVDMWSKLETSISQTSRKNLLSDEAAKKISELLKSEPKPEKVAQTRLNAFATDTGMHVIRADNADIKKLIDMYFSYSAPFEKKDDKKREFPDAITLLSLEKWAESQKIKVLAVSRDKGWQGYAKKSEWIDVTPDLTEALQLLQKHAEQAEKVIAKFLNKLGTKKYKGILDRIKEAIANSVSSLDVYAEATSYFRVEGDSVALELKEFSFIDLQDFSIVQIGRDLIVVEVPVLIKATASTDFSLYAWDSVDKEEISLGSQAAVTDVEFEASALITFEIDSSVTPNEIHVLEIELVKTIDSVDFGEIEIERDPEDYDYEE